ncbi:MAG TPA: BTAD domain-containing putative transcriptional regulator [Anaerolineales bacterium]|nr:BTAD domain-containing putative transcriptional regulator [Anaerolineales bacterium]
MLQIRLLGQFDVRLDGKRLTIPSRAGQSLFAYLALTAGTSHRREKLAGTFWPDTSDESARKYLRQELWRIRKAISTYKKDNEEYLLADDFTIAFNRDSEYWLDAAQVERPDLDLESLTTNLSLYQGELLPGFYEEWIIIERERIQSIFDTKMGQLLEQLIASERWTAVQEQSERWLSMGNSIEPAYRGLMLSYGARGDMARVSTVYQRCIADLDEKFGLEPSAETRALYDGLLKGSYTVSRSTQPSGTVTFLFTDIEGSTSLLEKLQDEYAAVLTDHHRIMRNAIQKWNGREVDTQGDAFFVTFSRALDAVQCAAEAQREFAAHKWLHKKPLRVRMGLHTDEPLLASTGYVGMDVHRAARIGDAGHGGQILLSQTTRTLVANDLPKELTIRDLGEFRLKDLKFPTPIHQLVVEGLAAEFPPLRTKFSALEPPTPGEAPFKGLQYFDEVDSDLFHGRELLTAKLVNRLNETKFLSVVIGASGSGKSSLVRAGLIPALKNGVELMDGTKPPEGSSGWHVHVITPTAHPLEALSIELTRDLESLTAAATLMDDLLEDPRSLGLFLERKYPKGHVLLVLDQLEELFTLCRDEFEREAFIDNLLTALNPSPLRPSSLGRGDGGEGNITLILTLRADFYAHLAQYPELRDAVARQQEYIGPMTLEELRRAIEEPAKRGNWEFEPGLVDLILRDVGDEPGALPLLSHALLETWKRRAGHTMTLKGYADAGGVRGAIAYTAETVYQSHSPEEQAIARNIFLRLTELGEGTEDTRRRVSFDELLSNVEDADEVRSVLTMLADARLVTLGEDTVEVAHEALIREWPTLREWLNQDREGLQLHRRLTETAREWELLEHDEGVLYRGAQLTQAREWAALHPRALNVNEQAFLDASDAFEQKKITDREAQQRRELEAAQKLAEIEHNRAEEQTRAANRMRVRNRVITAVGSIAVILAILAGMFGFQSNQNAISAQNNAATAQVAKDNALGAEANAEAERLRAENEKQIAISRELAIAAVDNLDVDPQRSILLALEALKSNDTPEAENALHRAVQASRVQLILHHKDVVEDVIYSPDGNRLATASNDGTAKIWDADTGQELLTLNTGPINTIAFDPTKGETILATAYYDDKNAAIWDTVTGQKLLTLMGHTEGINRIAFSPDGTRIATASSDNTAKIWDATSGEELFTLSGYSDFVTSVAFSPDGTRLVVGSVDTTVGIWDIATGQELFTLSNITEGINDVTFSPDGTILATAGSRDEAVRLWDAATGQAIRTISSGQGQLIYDIAYSMNGSLIVTSSLDGTARVWDTSTGTELLTLPGHATSLSRAAFSPDGTRLATASYDGTARVWDITPEGSREWLTIAKHTDNVRDLDYSPDGSRIVTASSDGSAKVFDAETGAELLTLSGHTARVYTAVFSPDGTRIATSSGDNTAKVWDAATGEELLTLSGHGEGMVGGFFPGILAVAYSPDGKLLATAGADGNTILWDATTGEQLGLFSNNSIGITNLAFSPDGKYLVTTTDQPPSVAAGEDATTQLWDLTSGQQVFVASQPVRIWGLAFNNNGTRFATAGFGGIVRIRDAGTGQELFELSGLTRTVGSVTFSPDGSMLATANSNGVILWDANTGNELLRLTNNGRFGGVKFSPDGTRLAATDGVMVRIYLLNVEELIELAKSRLTRSLTTEECQQYLHVEQCP